MASNREQRRLERQRGAGAHQIADVSFGFVFPGAEAETAVEIQDERAPQADELSLPSSTPATQRRGALTSNARSTPKRGAIDHTPNTNSANISAKRRKLDEPSSLRTNTSQMEPQGEIYDLPVSQEGDDASQDMDELDGEPDIVDTLPESISTRKATTTPRRQPQIAASPEEAPGIASRRNRASGGSRVKGKTPKNSMFVSSNSTITPVTTRATRPRQAQSGSAAGRRQPSPETLRPTSTLQRRALSEELDELSPEQARPKGELFSDVDEDEVAEALDDRQAARELQKRRRKPRRRLSAEDVEVDELDVDEKILEEVSVEDEGQEEEAEYEDEPEMENEDVESEVEPQVPVRRRGRPKLIKSTQQSSMAASPAVQRQPKGPKDQKKKPRSSNTGAPKDSVIIPVHRLTNPIMLAEGSTDADILNAEMPFAKRGGVNAVDVLAEFTEEVIDGALESLRTGGSNAEDSSARKEYRLKLRAVEAFQEELRVRLLDLTIKLDGGHQLSKRVRASQLEVKHLRGEVLRLRQEREKIAIRKDDVRIKHESSSKDLLEQSTLSTSLQDIELAVERCRALPRNGKADLPPAALSIALATVAAKASAAAPERGILVQVKDFNAFLERAAMALEGKS